MKYTAQDNSRVANIGTAEYYIFSQDSNQKLYSFLLLGKAMHQRV